MTSFTGYQLGSFSDVLRRVNDLHLQLQTEKWRALQRPISLAARLLGFCSEVAPKPLWLHGSQATGAAAAQFLLNFQGLHNFPPAVSHNF